MNIAIVGFDIEGKSSFAYWHGKGHDITICDRNPYVVVPEGIASQLGSDYLENLDRFDVIVRTPGLHPQNILQKNPGVKAKITSCTNEFLRACPTKNIIGVTGTKGKGTTSTLIAKMLEASGKSVHLGGNIGRAALDIMGHVQPDDWVVLELSNFQLIDITYAPRIAVCLTVVPEHLDWHESVDEYYGSKQQLFLHQSPNDVAIYYAKSAVSREIATSSPGAHIPYFAEPGAVVEDDEITIDGESICEVSELKLLGKHNWQNACAAVTAVWQATQNVPAIRSVLTTFPGLEHRLEFVRTLKNVRYYNDSFGTNPETAIVAMQAFSEPKVIVLGGSNKNANYDELARTVQNSNVREVILIGETAPAIESAIRQTGYSSISHGGASMREIVASCKDTAQPGDVVLLSTGCASFGMFNNYKDRGNQFKEAVRALS